VAAGHTARRLFDDRRAFDITGVDLRDVAALRAAGHAGGVLRSLG